jgi:hypothetical protein
LSGTGYDNDPARRSVIYPTPALPKPNSGGAVCIHRVAIGSGLWETVDVAKPTKEDKIRRRAKKPQRKSDKEGAAGVRRDHDGIGKLIDSPEIRNPKEDFGQSAAQIEREATES